MTEKSFRVVPPSEGKGSKKFVLLAPPPDNPPPFEQQLNSYDCGPCMILNILRNHAPNDAAHLSIPDNRHTHGLTAVVLC